MSAMQGALSAAERSMRSVFVGNIPYEATEEQLKDIFAEVGPVVSFRLVYDRETGKPKGYGFCEYKDQEMALSAMRNLNGYELNGRALRVDNAASEKSKEELKNLQASLGGPPVESPYGPDVGPDKAPDAISKIMCSNPPEQLYELMSQMKSCLESNPNEARNLLIQNPQLSYALLQAQVIMKIIEPNVAKCMLHSADFQPPPIGALLPTPEKSVPVSNAPPVANDGPNYPSAMPPAPVPGMQAPNMMSQPRPTQPVPPLNRPALLGERPQGPNPMPQNPFQEQGDQRPMPDRDHRPMPDRDLRGPLMMGGDKDMRHLGGDHDLRQMQGGPPDNRDFDPRFRNQPGPGGMRMQGPPDPRGMQGPNMGSPFNGRQGPPAAAVNDPRAMPGPRPPQNPRIAAVGGASPMGGGSPKPQSSPRPTNPIAAVAAAVAPHDSEKAALIMQVLQLSDQQIAMLPPEQRQSIMILKEQISSTL
ncbi:hypothetical protein JTE90_009778 [Oedothorax gibbosus]|uniref:RRM domain-containing protein n=1 Tax=Oedothorax gibbosus TaxID=931172 RepID=A0AAV6V9H0_9ARAC|nr:hypothetical protein JTE90_009778 [Oedothorax gibbosus]